jgi:hypothetical protein
MRIKQELMSAPHGHKTTIVHRWAVIVGLAPQTLYRRLELGGREREAAPVRPELREWAKVVASVKKRPPEEAGEISTDQAVRIAIEAKLIPVSAMDVAVATFDRVMREIGTTKKSVRATRFQAKVPNQAHHFDASTSKFFFVARRLPDGDYVLRMHRPARYYKNKPVPVDALRPWYYGMVDDHSGRKCATMIVSQGENAADSLLAVDKFWRVLGVPKKLLADQGMLKKCLASSGYIKACGVELPQMMPYAKRGHGKIENPWKTQWQRFEKPFFAVSDWEKFELAASELNRRLERYIEEENARPHRFERELTRMDAWRRVMLAGGITVLPGDALSRAHRVDERKVGVDGLISLDGVTYEVKGLHDAWVYVYQSMFEDRLVAEDKETSERYEVKNFAPLDEGEYRNYDDTPHERAVKDGTALVIPESALPYRETRDEGRGTNVVSLPIKRTEREVESVFILDSYATTEDALEDLCGTVGTFIADADRAALSALIEENGRSRAYVRELAMEIRGEIEQQRMEQRA